MPPSWPRRLAPVAACLMLIACGDGVPDQAEAEDLIRAALKDAARAAARQENKEADEYIAMVEAMTIKVQGLTRDSDTQVTAAVTTASPGRRTKSGRIQLVRADGEWHAIIE